MPLLPQKSNSSLVGDSVHRLVVPLLEDDLYTCRFADGRFPTINGKINNFETIEKARKEAKRWGAVEIVICRQLADGSWVEHATADIEPNEKKNDT